MSESKSQENADRSRGFPVGFLHASGRCPPSAEGAGMGLAGVCPKLQELLAEAGLHLSEMPKTLVAATTPLHVFSLLGGLVLKTPTTFNQKVKDPSQ